MTVVGMGELAWLILAVLLGLSVVITWIIKAERSRNFFREEVRRLRSQLEALECEKAMMVEEMQAFREGSMSPAGAENTGAADPGKMIITRVMEKSGELEKENERLKKELSEAKSSLEEVYKALCDNK